MIKKLKLKNFLLFENEVIEFHKKSNALVGETGAGKSMIFSAINVLCGERNDKSLIMVEKEFYELEMEIEIKDIKEEIKVKLSEYLEKMESDEIIIFRKLNISGKSQIRINNIPVTLNELKEVTNLVINMHKQNTTLEILKEDNQIKMINNMLEESLLNEYQEQYYQYQKINKILETKIELDEQKEEELEILNFKIDQIKEIKNLDSEENLEKIIESQKIITTKKENINKIMKLLKEVDVNIEEIEFISEKEEFKNEIDIVNEVKSMNNIVKELDYTLSKHEMEFDFDISIDQAMEELSIIRRLKRKYNLEYQGLIDKMENLETEKNNLENLGQEIIKLEHQKNEILENLENLSDEITKQRKNIIMQLEKKINEEFYDLKMPNAELKIDIQKINYNEFGQDKIEFLLKTNKGYDFSSLNKIASGGEKSRIMLIFKKILNEINPIPTLLLDEIDQGVSGEVAKKIGEKIEIISKMSQIIIISHTPQVLRQIENLIKIEKNNEKSITISCAHTLNEEEKKNFINNMLEI